MVGHQSTPPFEQVCSLLLVEGEVGGQTLAGFFDVGTGLVKSKRKAVHSTHEVDGQRTICRGSTLEGGTGREEACAPEQERGPLFGVHGADQHETAGVAVRDPFWKLTDWLGTIGRPSPS